MTNCQGFAPDDAKLARLVFFRRDRDVEKHIIEVCRNIDHHDVDKWFGDGPIRRFQ